MTRNKLPQLLERIREVAKQVGDSKVVKDKTYEAVDAAGVKLLEEIAEATRSTSGFTSRFSPEIVISDIPSHGCFQGNLH